MTTVPANAKKPADRKAKKDEVQTALTATVRGRDWQIPAEAVDDFELLDAFAQLRQTDDVSLVPFILRRLLDEQWRDAMNLLRNKNTGRVSLEDGMEFTQELMGALNPNS